MYQLFRMKKVIKGKNKDIGQTRYLIDLFAGCGGLSLGFEMANFKPIMFNEVNRHASETYLVNRKRINLVKTGDINEVTNKFISQCLVQWRKRGIDDVDVLCGGPPCQGYSGIGHRRTFDLHKSQIPSNLLYKEMSRLISYIRPKVFLFENVKGLLSSRWTKGGEKGEIFRDVLNEFRSISGYSCDWSLVRAKDYGVPQNRPRILLIGYRCDVWQPPEVDEVDTVANGMYSHGYAIRRGMLPSGSESPPGIRELISDLDDPRYREKKATTSYPWQAKNSTQEALRSYPDGNMFAKGDPLTEHEYTKHSLKIEKKFQYMIDNDGEIPSEYRTKKFAQKVLPQSWKNLSPNITATSLPDDYVHYLRPRILTVREWARIQTFPDWYNFAGPRTTGGRRRAGDPSSNLWDREVPKYTQIGNAVPVKLANAVADHIRNILDNQS